jgi:CheY-like chemotaxis protein
MVAFPIDNDLISVRFEVRDTGIGIPTEEIDRLFQPFVQSDSSTTRRYGGSGLGLAIARRLVELMGGKIGATSVPGQGSTFWFTASFEPGTKIEQTAPAAKEAASGARVLLVEDNAINRKVASLHLARLGCQVEAATSGQEAISALQRSDFDLVLMDCEMPEMDGYEATRRIRSTNSGVRQPTIPIVALTANAMPADRDRCLEAGMNAFLPKPFRSEGLLEILQKWVPPKV